MSVPNPPAAQPQPPVPPAGNVPVPPPGYAPVPPLGYAPGAPVPPPITPQKHNVLALIAMIVAIVGFIFACIPGALVVGWVLLPIAFVLSIVSLFLKGDPKWMGTVGLIVAVVGTVVAFIVFFAVVATAFNDAFGSGETSVSQPVDEGAMRMRMRRRMPTSLRRMPTSRRMLSQRAPVRTRTCCRRRSAVTTGPQWSTASTPMVTPSPPTGPCSTTRLRLARTTRSSI